jgi:hypothetical protein
MLNNISAFTYIIALGVIVGLLFFQKLSPQYIRLLVALLLITLLIEVGAVWFYKTFRIKNHWIYNVFTPVQFFLMWSMFFRSSISKNRYFIYSAILLGVFFFINIFWWQGYTMFNSYTFMLSGALITFYTLSYLANLYRGEEVHRFNKEPMFWVCIGILFYFPANIIVTGFIYELYKYSKDLSIRLYHINKILNILMYSFFLI